MLRLVWRKSDKGKSDGAVTYQDKEPPSLKVNPLLWMLEWLLPYLCHKVEVHSKSVIKEAEGRAGN